MKRIISLLLLLCLLSGALLACDPVKPADTTDAQTRQPAESTGADITDAPDTGSSSTDAPGTGAPSTDAPGTSAPSTDAPDTSSPSTSAPDTDSPTTSSPETTTPVTTKPVTTPPVTTVPVTTVPADEGGPTDAAYVTFDKTNVKSALSGANACTYSVEKDDKEGWVLKFITSAASGDPYISFNYKNYMAKYKLGQVSAADYKYILLKIKTENCSASTFELFYACGGLTGAAAGYSKQTVFDNSEPGWQYIMFDLSDKTNWSGKVNAFRFDFLTSAAGKGESVSIAAIIFAKNREDVIDLISSGESSHGLTAAEQKKAEELLKIADVAPTVANTKLTAAKEDADISLWFDHTYTKTPAETVKSNGSNTYQMRLAKNELEACQFLLSTTAAKENLTAELTGFSDGKGNTLRAEMFKGFYFDEKVDGNTTADPIPPLSGAFSLKANTSSLFLIKVFSEDTTPAGQYSAVLTIKDSSGNEIKKANVYAYVWDFALPEASSCKTLADLSWWNIYASHGAYDPAYYNGDDSLTYSKYYDLLLENRICCYTLPYSTEGKFDDSRINKYLDDPRVVAFNPVGWKVDISTSNLTSAYNYLSQKAEWLDKAYFYTVDEPAGKTQLDKVISDAKLIKTVFKDYKLIVPMHLNSALDSTSQTDFFSYIKDYVNVWCPHTFFYNSFADYKSNPFLTYRCSARIEDNLGTFQDRMETEQAGGDEVWWYVTRFPESPEITLTLDTRAVNYRIMFWQQKLYNVDGFLYYSVNDWVNGQSENNGWNAKHETDAGHPYDVYGNGVLVYCGARAGVAGPVGSLRLECVRDGIDDYDYFTLLDSLYGEGTSDLIIKQITTSLGEYESNEAMFTRLRIAVGNLIAAK